MTEPYVPAVVTEGILDLSHWQPSHDFAAAKASGVLAIIAKATQGGYVDPAWHAHAAAARTAGLLLGAYEFLDGSDPIAQADKLIDTVNDLTVPLFLDAERNPSSQVSVAIVAAIAQRIRDRLGYWPPIYMGRDGPAGTGTGLPNATLSNCELWLPEYGRSPICPPGWEKWRLWQFTDGTGQQDVPGIGKCDHSRFDGTAAELRAWWSAVVSSTGVQPTPAPLPDPASVPAPPPPSAPVLTRALREGVAWGEDVEKMQEQLKAIGFDVDVDGIFGPGTDQAVRTFQKDKGLIEDGIVMPADPAVPNSGETWTALWAAKPLTA